MGKISKDQLKEEIKQDLSNDLDADNYIRQPGFATTAGTSTAYTITLNPAVTYIPEGFCVTIVPHVDCGNSPSLNVCGLGAMYLKKRNGNYYGAGHLKAGLPYTFRKIGTVFILQSEIASGNATAFDLFSGRTASMDAGEITGAAAPKGVNIIKNGNFAQGTEMWSPEGTNIASSGNELSSLPFVQYGGPVEYIPNHTAYLSHQIYVCADIKVTDGNTYVVFNDGVAQLYLYPTVYNSYERVSGIWTVSPAALRLYMKMQDNRTNGWTTSYLKNCMAIDLTAMFGAGKEPSKVVMDQIVQNAGGWWDSPLNILLGDTTATVDKVLNGQKFYDNTGVLKIGSMPVAINGPVYEESSELYIGASGVTWMKTQGNKYFYDGTWLKFTEPNLIASNVKAGVTIGSTTKITGTFTADATATASKIMSGYSAYVNGVKINGTGVDGTGMKKAAYGTFSGSSGLSISGLGFTPSRVAVYSNASYGWMAMYVSGSVNILVQQGYDNQQNPIAVYAGGFSTNGGSSYITYYWMAIE